MTDRRAGYVVVLAKDVREDDAEAIVNALRMIKGVQSVEPVIADAELVIAESRAKTEVRGKVYEALRQFT